MIGGAKRLGSGWFKESGRHALAAKGISSAPRVSYFQEKEQSDRSAQFDQRVGFRRIQVLKGRARIGKALPESSRVKAGRGEEARAAYGSDVVEDLGKARQVLRELRMEERQAKMLARSLEGDDRAQAFEVKREIMKRRKAAQELVGTIGSEVRRREEEGLLDNAQRLRLAAEDRAARKSRLEREEKSRESAKALLGLIDEGELDQEDVAEMKPGRVRGEKERLTKERRKLGLSASEFEERYGVPLKSPKSRPELEGDEATREKNRIVFALKFGDVFEKVEKKKSLSDSAAIQEPVGEMGVSFKTVGHEKLEDDDEG